MCFAKNSLCHSVSLQCCFGTLPMYVPAIPITAWDLITKTSHTPNGISHPENSIIKAIYKA